MNKLNKLTIFLPNLNLGGAQISIITIADYFKSKNIEVNFLIASKRPEYDLSYKLPSININYLNSNKTIFSIFKLRKEINKIKPDIILSTLPTPNFMVVALKFLKLIKSKVVIREASSNYLSWNRTNLNKILSTFAFNYSDANIFISNEQKRNYLKIINNENNFVIYNPVLTKDFYQKSNENLTEITKTKQLWVTVSRIEFVKGLDILLDTVREMSVLENIEILVIGSGSRLNEYKKEYKDLPVKFLGQVKNSIKFIKNADLFIFPSRREGLGNSLIEAQLLGKQIIASDCESGPKEIINLFSNGVLFKSENKKDLQEKLFGFVPKKDIIVSEDKKKLFSFDEVGKQYEKVFFKMLN